MATVTVCSRLPFNFVAEFAGKKVVFNGSKGKDITGEAVLIDGFGLTTGVDSEWFDGWAKEAHDFVPLQTGVIFTAAPANAADEAKELAPEVKSGLEPKSPEELGVEAVPAED
jgi:hypothetical protein